MITNRLECTNGIEDSYTLYLLQTKEMLLPLSIVNGVMSHLCQSEDRKALFLAHNGNSYQ